jgi:hypothetical protein
VAFSRTVPSISLAVLSPVPGVDWNCDVVFIGRDAVAVSVCGGPARVAGASHDADAGVAVGHYLSSIRTSLGSLLDGDGRSKANTPEVRSEKPVLSHEEPTEKRCTILVL